MNNNQRKELQKIVDKIEDLRIEVEYIRDEEQDKIDNMPENLQGSERYYSMEEVVTYLNDGISELENAIENLNSVINK